MKKRLLVLFLVVGFLNVLLAQSKKELKASLTQDLVTYRQLTEEGKIAELLDYMPPKMFDLFTRDSMTNFLVSSMDNELLKMEMKSMSIGKIPKIQRVDTCHWVLIPYDAEMDMQLKDSTASFVGIFIGMMKAQFGRENVTETRKGLYRVAMKDKKLVAYRTISDRHWYFIEDKRTEKGAEGRRQRGMMEFILPEPVLKALGN